MKHKILLYTSLVLLSVLFSCVKDDDDLVPIGHVLIVYMGGDNNLSDETYQKIEAIRSGWNASACNKLLIYQDAAETAPKLMEVVHQNGSNTLRTIKTYPEENSASAAVFARVVSQAKAMYPSPSYGLLVFSHASGWLPNATLTQPRSTTKSIIIDGNDQMELIDFANAIADKSFDYIVFEACFMAGIEVAYELKDKTDYIVASSAEILSPGFTQTYGQTINELFSGNLRGFAQSSFDYFNLMSGSQRSATFSIIKTQGLDHLATFVKNNCNGDQQVPLNDIQHFDRYSYRLFFDFGDYYSRLLQNDAQRQELNRLISDCVVWKASTPTFLSGYNGFEIRVHSGLTSYIPQQQFPFLNTEYTQLAWSKIIR